MTNRKSTYMPLHGRIDDVEDLSTLDLDYSFGDKYRTGSIQYSRFPQNGFRYAKEHFRKYIQEYDFKNLGRVVDLGGGYGRWAVFLAEVNDHVTVIERHPYLVDMGPRLSDHLGFDNIEFKRGSVENVPVVDEAYDAAWLHGLIFLTHRDKTLSEIARILKPGGRVFMGAVNSVGKMFMKMCHGYERGGLEDALCRQGMAALKGGPMAPGPPNYATKATLDTIFSRFGLEIDYQYPIYDFIHDDSVNSPYLSIFQDLPGLAAKFEQDNDFRAQLIEKYQHIMHMVEFDLWFSARKISNI